MIKFLASLILTIIVIIVAGTCLGVSLGVTIGTFYNIGEDWAKGITHSISSVVVNNYFDVFESQLSSATTRSDYLNLTSPLYMHQYESKNWTDFWVPWLLSVPAKHDYNGLDSLTIRFLDGFWAFYSLSRFADPTITRRTKIDQETGQIVENEEDGTGAAIVEWIENFNDNTATGLTVGGFKFALNNFSEISYSAASNYTHESLFIPRPLANEITSDIISLFNALKIQQSKNRITPCAITFPEHNFDARANRSWTQVLICGIYRHSPNFPSTPPTLIGDTIIGFNPQRDITSLLLSAPLSANANAFVIFSSLAYVYISTLTDIPTFTTTEVPGMTMSDTVPPGCSSSLVRHPLISPPRLGCFIHIHQYGYSPLRAISPSFATTQTSAYEFIENPEDGENYAIASQRLKLDLLLLVPLNIVVVLPEKDLHLDKVKSSIVLSVGLVLVVAVFAISVSLTVLHLVLKRLDDIQKKMIDVAELRNLESGDDDDDFYGEGNKGSSGSSIFYDEDDDDGIEKDEERKNRKLEKQNQVISKFFSFSSSAAVSRNASGDVNTSASEQNNSSSSKNTRSKSSKKKITFKNAATNKGKPSDNSSSSSSSSSDDNHNTSRKNRSWIAEIANLEDAYAETVKSITNFTRYVSRAVVSELILQRRRYLEMQNNNGSSTASTTPTNSNNNNNRNATSSAINMNHNNANQNHHQIHSSASSQPSSISSPSPDFFASEYEVTVMLADIDGFSTQIWKTNPENHDGVLYILHIYFRRMCRLIMGHGGVVDKFLGDSIMSYWGAPVRTENHALLATLAALSLVRESRRDPLKKIFQSTLRREVQLRCGLASGSAIVGTFGNAESVNYSIVGAPVTQARQLQDFNQYWSSSILMEGNCARRLDDMIVNRLLCQALFERASSRAPDHVYEVMGVNPESKKLNELLQPLVSLHNKNNTNVNESRTIAFSDVLSLPTIRSNAGQGVPEILRATVMENDDNNNTTKHQNQESTTKLFVANLLAWHAKYHRTALPQTYVEFAENFSEATRLMIERNFAESSERFEKLEVPKPFRVDLGTFSNNNMSNSATLSLNNNNSPNNRTGETNNSFGSLDENEGSQRSNKSNATAGNQTSSGNLMMNSSQYSQQSVHNKPIQLIYDITHAEHALAILLDIANVYVTRRLPKQSIHEANTFFICAYKLTENNNNSSNNLKNDKKKQKNSSSTTAAAADKKSKRPSSASSNASSSSNSSLNHSSSRGNSPHKKKGKRMKNQNQQQEQEQSNTKDKTITPGQNPEEFA